MLYYLSSQLNLPESCAAGACNVLIHFARAVKTTGQGNALLNCCLASYNIVFHMYMHILSVHLYSVSVLFCLAFSDNGEETGSTGCKL